MLSESVEHYTVLVTSIHCSTPVSQITYYDEAGTFMP